MKMANKIYGLVLLAFASAGTLSAQQGGTPPTLDRQVDVSRDYVPDVQRASKLDVKPDMADTVALRPEFEYSVQPSPWSTGFGVVAINPARVEMGRDMQRPFYLKAGGGYPGQSLLDFYLTGGGASASGGVYVNHYGRYNKLRNELGYKARALETQNSAGVFGRVGLGGRISLTGDVGADYDLWSLYGRAVMPNRWASAHEDVKSPLQSHFTPRVNIAVGHDFTDLSFLNFRAGAKFYHIDSRTDDRETGIGAFAEAARRFGQVHTLSLKLSLDNRHTVHRGIDGHDWAGRKTDNTVLGGGVRYAGDFGRLSISLGLDAAHDNRGLDDSKLYLLPQAMIRLDMTGKGSSVLYLSMESSLVDNGYRSLTERNPYYSWRHDSYGTWNQYFYTPNLPHNSREFIARGGISGNLSGVFSYNVYAGYGWYLDPAFFYTLYPDYDDATKSVYDVAWFSRMTAFHAGAEVEGRISGGFTAGASAKYYDYSPSKDDIDVGGSKVPHLRPDFAPGLPEYEGEIYVKYAYRDKFRIRAGVQLTGKRKFFELETIDVANISTPLSGSSYAFVMNSVSNKAVADVSLEAEYFVNPGFGVFLSGHNLADQKLYPYNHYRGHGISVDAGVQLTF